MSDYSEKIKNLLNCPFEVKMRSPCERLYRLIAIEEENGAITMIFELVKEEDDRQN